MKKIRTAFSKLKIPYRVIKKVMILVYIVFVLFALYHVIFAQRVIPGVYVGTLNLSGKTYDQALSALKENESNIPNEIKLIYKDSEEFPITKQDIGLNYSWESSVKRAFEVGRTGNILTDTKDKIAGLFLMPLNLPAKYTFDEQLLSNKLAMVKAEVYVEPKEAGVALVDGKLTVQDSQIGLKVEEELLYNAVMYSYNYFYFSPIDIPYEVENPTVKEEDIEALMPQIEKIVLNTLTVKYKSPVDNKVDKNTKNISLAGAAKDWKLEKDQILDFLTFRKENENSDVEIKIYGPKFHAFLETLSQEVNQLPRGKVTETNGDKVVKFEIVQPGFEIDGKKFEEDFKTALLNGDKEVELAIKEVSDGADKEKYGIHALLGEGKSNFAGSIRGRINNLTLAASRTDGVLVPPGTVYSMNNTIGAITGATGYDVAYIIQNGRTVLGEGGGVCQTSTTLFRAVLDSGLPVVMRYPHAYRVHYYEEDSPPGIDASIFQPSLDFKFKNDTKNYVMIQTSWDLDKTELYFKIYGTPDGRTVEMTTPTLTNVSGAPASQYIDDPTLAKGVVRQIDWSAPGGTTSFTRVVKRGEEVLYNDTFTTRYQPWRAVFLRGTKE